MRARSHETSAARCALALVAASVAGGAACSLTTDLDGYTGPPGRPDALDAGFAGDGPRDAMPSPGGDGGADAAGVAYGAAVADDRPVAWYRFDDATSSPTAKDSVGSSDARRSTRGVVFGGVGIAGGAAVLTGEGQLEVGDRFGFAGLVPFTLELWMKPNEGTLSSQLIVKRDESAPPEFKGYVLYRGDDRSVHFEGWGADLSAWTNGPIERAASPRGFSHVVLVVSYETGKGNASVYVDGVRQGPGGFDNVTPLPSTAAPLLLGRGFAGLLDEVAIYDRALTFPRIRAHFEAGR